MKNNNKVRDIALPDIKPQYKAKVIKRVWYWQIYIYTHTDLWNRDKI